MNRTLANLLGLVSIIAVCAVAWAAISVALLADSARLSLPDLSPSVTKLNQALDTVNHPCAPGPCGTLATVNKLTVKVGDLAVTSQLQEAHVGQLVTATAHNLDRAGDSVQQVASALSGTATAATGTLQQARVNLVSMDADLTAARPLIDAYTQSGRDLDGILTDNRAHIASTLANVDGMAASGNGILGDARKVSDKLTNDFVAPKPWWKKIGPSLSDVWDYGALVARHTP